MTRLNVGLVYGGRSAEREVSNLSARAIYEHLDENKYCVFPIPVSAEGVWTILPSGHGLPDLGREKELLHSNHQAASQPLAKLPVPGMDNGHGRLIESVPADKRPRLDLIFPMIHGTYGEDGSLQGFLELCGLPYVGAGVSGSALGMDKALMKDVLRAHGVPVVPYWVFRRAQWEKAPGMIRDTIEEKIGFPCFSKPARTGSSVGIRKIHARSELNDAIHEACRFDSTVMVEKGLPVRELECGVIGNDEPEVSVVGEVIPDAEFYDYHAKYLSEGTRIIIPAEIDASTAQRTQTIACQAYQVLRCSGYARVDLFFERDTGQVYLNEINTIPGFTSRSMFPMLWEASGLPFSRLLDRLIDLALERFRDEGRNEVTVPESGLIP